MRSFFTAVFIFSCLFGFSQKINHYKWQSVLEAELFAPKKLKNTPSEVESVASYGVKDTLNPQSQFHGHYLEQFDKQGNRFFYRKYDGNDYYRDIKETIDKNGIQRTHITFTKNKITDKYYDLTTRLNENKYLVKVTGSTEIHTYKKDRNNNMVESIKYYREGNDKTAPLIYRGDRIMLYDQGDNQLLDSATSPEGKRYVSKYTYETNNDNIILIEKFNNGKLELKSDYVYNEKGDVIECTDWTYSGDMEKILFKYTCKYTYDDKNNWIKLIMDYSVYSFKSFQPQENYERFSVIERKIKYH